MRIANHTNNLYIENNHLICHIFRFFFAIQTVSHFNYQSKKPNSLIIINLKLFNKFLKIFILKQKIRPERPDFRTVKKLVTYSRNLALMYSRLSRAI